MESELIEISRNLGFKDVDGYFPSSDCLDTLYELLDFLNSVDHPLNRRVSFLHSGILINDIIPLVCSTPTDTQIQIALFQLLEVATAPFSKFFSEQDDNRENAHFFGEIVDLQLDMRYEISNSGIFFALFNFVMHFLKSNKIELVQTILNILRNIFDESVFWRVDSLKRYESVSEKLLCKFFECNLDKVLLLLTNNSEYNDWIFNAMGLIFNLLNHVNAETVVEYGSTNISNLSKSLDSISKSEKKCRQLRISLKRKRYININESSSMEAEIFDCIHRSIIQCLDKLDLEKKMITEHIKTLNYGVLCYLELVNGLNHLKIANNSAYNHAADILMEKIFYTSDHKEIFLNIIQKISQGLFSNVLYIFKLSEFSRNLFLTFSVFRECLNKFCTRKGVFSVKVDAKQKKRRKWKKIETILRSMDISPSPYTEITTDYLVESSNLSSEVHPKIRELLSRKEYESALKLYLNLDFECKPYSFDEVVLGLKKIFLEETTNDLDSSSSRSDFEYEKLFDYDKYMQKFVCLSVAKVCSHLLEHYSTNSTELNCHVLQLIAFVTNKLKFPELFYHISYFEAFRKILSLPDTDQSVLKPFFEFVSKHQNKGLIDILFWKPVFVVSNIYQADQYGAYCPNGDKFVDFPSNPIDHDHKAFKVSEIERNNYLPSIQDDLTTEYNATVQEKENRDFEKSISLMARDHVESVVEVNTTNLTNDTNKTCDKKLAREDIEIIEYLARDLIKDGCVSIIKWIVNVMSEVSKASGNDHKNSDELFPIVHSETDDEMIKRINVVQFLCYCECFPPTDDVDDKYWKISHVPNIHLLRVLEDILEKNND
ncbi:Protein timeless [Thelohanellus kitauei]|uniref:Protein timeless n=1 Tax=Thelohanellus kitauei TaxID=669202 RepID=A0A0C2JCP7_THEKT|nr:Protein timeless [Thelohanellus kitauei]